MSQATSEVINSARPTLMPLIQGFMASRVVHVATELGIAGLLADGTKLPRRWRSKRGRTKSLGRYGFADKWLSNLAGH